MLDEYKELRHHDHLLYVLTARQKTTYTRLKDIIEDLYVSRPEEREEPERPTRFIVSQSLEALGHCILDFEEGSSDVRVSAPALNRLPTAREPRAVLSGARSAETVPLIAKKCQEVDGIAMDISPASEAAPFVPLRVELRASKEEHLARVADALGIQYWSQPPALQIASSVGMIDEYLDSLPSPKTGELQGWPGRRDYYPGQFRFQQKPRDSDLRLIRYEHPHERTDYYFLFRGEKRQKVDREWGRYAVLRETSHRALAFDDRRMVVVVPNGARLPGLHARALSLCSGYPPRFLAADEISINSRLRVPKPERHGYHVYRWIPPAIINTIAQKLGQHILEATIKY
jgi:hypothetical protein